MTKEVKVQSSKPFVGKLCDHDIIRTNFNYLNPYTFLLTIFYFVVLSFKPFGTFLFCFSFLGFVLLFCGIIFFPFNNLNLFHYFIILVSWQMYMLMQILIIEIIEKM
jgi:hypothetical protein